MRFLAAALLGFLACCAPAEPVVALSTLSERFALARSRVARARAGGEVLDASQDLAIRAQQAAAVFANSKSMSDADAEAEAEADIEAGMQMRGQRMFDYIARVGQQMEALEQMKLRAKTEAEWESVNAAYTALEKNTQFWTFYDFWYRTDPEGPEIVAIFPADASGVLGRQQLEIHVHCKWENKQTVCDSTTANARFYDRQDFAKFSIVQTSDNVKWANLFQAITRFPLNRQGVAGTVTINTVIVAGTPEPRSYTGATPIAPATTCHAWNTADHIAWLRNTAAGSVCIFGNPAGTGRTISGVFDKWKDGVRDPGVQATVKTRNGEF